MSTESVWYSDHTTLLEELQRAAQRRSPTPTIPGYDNLRELARGGQGVVYLAQQISMHRRVAVKVLYEDSLSSHARWRRFEREIELVAALRHPHIVSVYDSGVTSDQRPYYIMEYVEGASLDEFLRRWRTLDLRQILRLIVKICRGVGHAHLHGVIHRDVKPSNIRISADGEPHVLDFGAAKPITVTTEGVAPACTLPGQFWGTLAYASPEQLHGQPDSVDIRTDVYSLGVMLYEAITGVLPIEVRGSMADAVRAILETEPRKPSAVLREMAREGSAPHWYQSVGDELDTIALVALAKNREHRYSSAEALADDLERLLAGDPIDAKRDSHWYILRKTLKRYRWQTALATSLLTTMVVLLVAFSWMYYRVSIEAAKANQIRVFLEDTFASVEPSQPGVEVTLRETLDDAVHWVDMALSGQPEIEASLRATIGNSYRVLGRFGESEQQLYAALELRRTTFRSDHPELAQSTNALALLRRDEGDLAAAESLMREALAMRRRLGKRSELDTAFSLQNLADVLRRQRRFDEAQSCLGEALSICLRRWGDRHPDTVMIQFQMAELAHETGDVATAQTLHKAVLAARRQVLDPHHPDLARSLQVLGSLMLADGHPAECEPLLRECVEIWTRIRPDGHGQVLRATELWKECIGALP